MKMFRSAAYCGTALAAALFTAPAAGAQSVAPADKILASLPGTAWEGAFDISVAGKKISDSIPIRLVNADHYESNGRLGYFFAMPANHSDLSEAISAVEPGDQEKCVQNPGLSSERYTSVQSDGDEPGVYSGKVFVSSLRYDELAQACKPVEIPLTIRSFTVTGSWPRRSLTIEIAPIPLPGKLIPDPDPVSIVYRFVEKNPNPGDWKGWLKELNP
jgi:hypothetical protein